MGFRVSIRRTNAFQLAEVASYNQPVLTFYPRQIELRLLEALEDSPVVLIHGPRQCGKTTLAQVIGEPRGYIYLNFDEDVLRGAAEADPVGFVADLPERAILDEVQRVPGLFLALKTVVDRRRTAGRFMLTGSANVLLVPKLADSLAGRMQLLRLHPLSQSELARQKSSFLEALFGGGFRLTGTIRVFEDRIQLPRVGEVRLKENNYLPLGKHSSASVTERAGRWFVSAQTVAPVALCAGNEKVLGIDVGVSRLAVLSDGTVYDNSKALGHAERLLRVRQKAVSRKVNGSKNRQKAATRLARLHYRITNIRKDAIHKATSAVIAKQPGAVVVESLNVNGMLKNHTLAKAVSDASMSEFLRQIRYKATWNGIRVVEAPVFFPSSKMCAVCGSINTSLILVDRKWTCPTCGSVLDRDVNAANNLKNLAVSSTATACCPGSAGFILRVLAGWNETPSWAGTKHRLPSGING